MRIEGPSGLPPTNPQDNVTYLTQKGDSLQSIAGKFSVSTEALAQENNMQVDDEVREGIQLRIPARSEQGESSAGVGNLADNIERDSAAYVSPFEKQAGLVLEGPEPKWSEYVRWSEKGKPADLGEQVQLPSTDIDLDTGGEG